MHDVPFFPRPEGRRPSSPYRVAARVASQPSSSLVRIAPRGDELAVELVVVARRKREARHGSLRVRAMAGIVALGVTAVSMVGLFRVGPIAADNALAVLFALGGVATALVALVAGLVLRAWVARQEA